MFRIVHLDGADREARRPDGVCEPGSGRSLVCGMDDRNVGQVSLPKNAGTGPPSGLAPVRNGYSMYTALGSGFAAGTDSTSLSRASVPASSSLSR